MVIIMSRSQPSQPKPLLDDPNGSIRQNGRLDPTRSSTMEQIRNLSRDPTSDNCWTLCRSFIWLDTCTIQAYYINMHADNKASHWTVLNSAILEYTISLLVLWAKSTTKDYYIRAESKFLCKSISQLFCAKVIKTRNSLKSTKVVLTQT